MKCEARHATLAYHTNGGLACPRRHPASCALPIRSDALFGECAIHDPDHVQHGQLVGQQDAHLGRLRSRRPFVPAAWKLLGGLSEPDIRVKQ